MKLSLLLALGSATLFTLFFQVCEHEPNDTLAEATTLEVAPHGDRAVLAAGRLERGDVDHFSFEAEAGDVVTAALRDDTAGELADAVLAIYGPGDDTKPLAKVDDVGLDLAPLLALPIAISGTHTIAIAGFGDGKLDGSGHREDFAYRLAVTRSPELVEHDAYGRNDDPRRPSVVLLKQGRLVPRGAAVVAGSLTPGDVDHYLIPLVRHSVVTATIYDDAAGEFNDPRLVLKDMSLEVIAEDDDAGPGRLPRLVHPTGDSGRFALLVVEGYDADGDANTPHEEHFDYRLVVSMEDELERW